jgi:DnaK suppressor protein
MTQTEKRKLKESILVDIDGLKMQIKALEEKVKPIAPDCGLGRLTRLEAMGEQEVNHRVLDQSKLRFTRLKNALQRIEKASFGICIVCEEDIGLGRLSVRPESVSCVERSD